MKKWFTPVFASLLASSGTSFAQNVPDAPPPLEDPYDDDPYDDDAIEQPDERVTLDRFRSELSPYGRWVDTPEYGLIWIPHGRSARWRPYSDGEWRYTRHGWTFVSYDPWGWAPFHYGRWIFRAHLGGWCWIPGYEWGPAWVSWRYGGGYVAWAPLGPIGVSVSYYSTPGLWLAVNGHHFHGRLHHRHFMPTRRVREVVFHRTHHYAPDHRHRSRGPTVDYVTRVTRRPVQAAEIRRAPLHRAPNARRDLQRVPGPKWREQRASTAPARQRAANPQRAPRIEQRRDPRSPAMRQAPQQRAALRAPAARRDLHRAPAAVRSSDGRGPSVRAPIAQRDLRAAPSARAQVQRARGQPQRGHGRDRVHRK